MVHRRLIALFALAAGCAAPEGIEAMDPLGESSSAVHEKWFVELEEAPIVRGGDPGRLSQEKAQFRAQLAARGVPIVERYGFDRLWNGVSIHVEHRSAAALATLPGVKAIYPVVPIVLDALPPSHVPEGPVIPPVASAPDLATALAMTGADVAQSALGLTGEGVRVGVIDTGIDLDHPDLGGCFGPGCRIAFGHDLVGDDYDAGASGSLPVPDPIPDDCAGHGTHVAGIVGANGAVRGVAPGVVFGAYRVFGCSGTTDADVMIAAMEMAQADGMRVVNTSIGSAFQWPEYPTAKAALALVAAGVVVVASTGNSGPLGIWAAGAPGVGGSVIATASFDNTHVAQRAFTVSPDDAKVGFHGASAAPPAPTSGSFPLARTGTTTTLGDGCENPPAPGSLTGQVALIRRGSAPAPAPTCSFHAKAKAAMDAGAAGVVIYNNVAGQLSPTVSGSPPITIPVVAISEADGLMLNARLDAGPVTMTWTALTLALASATGGRISSFSSYGPAVDLSLKPDLGAPGGSIYSTYPLELGGYASLSGTSMASPHVAGAAALLIEARPDVPASGVRDLLQNTAIPALWPPNPAFADVVHRQGAGLIRVDAAALSMVTVTPAKLSLGESQAGPAARTLTVANGGAAAVTYDLSHLPAVSTSGSYWNPIVSATGAAAVVFAASSVTVPAGGAATVDVTITADAALADKALYGGYLVLTPQGGGAALRVPYVGFKGDYQAIQALTPQGGYPLIARRAGDGTFTPEPSGALFTLEAGDVPYVVLHLDHGVRRLAIDVFDAVKGKPYGNVVDTEWVGQGVSPGDTLSFSWDGTTVFNKALYAVPNGDYVLRLSVEKALDDPGAPAASESWTSPVVTLSHP